MNNLELLTYDYRMILNSQFQANTQEDIVIVTIDDQSIKELGSWPWAREYHASLISKLNQSGADLIAFDILFEFPKAKDNILAQAIKKANNIILPYKLNLKAYRNYFDFSNTKYKIVDMNYPVPKVKKNALGLGYLNLLADHEGTIRRLHLFNQQGVTPFAIKIAKTYNKQNERLARKELLINFKAQQDYFHKISYSKVLTGNFSSDFFKDKIVLIGAKGNSFQDYLTTPLAAIKGYLPGVMIHANIIDNYLENDFIKQLTMTKTIILLITFSLLCATAYYKLAPSYSLLSSFLTIIGVVIINLTLFIAYNLFIPLVPFLLVIIINLILSLLTWYQKIDKRKAKLKNIFSRYLAPEVIEKVLELSEEDYLQGTRREVTVLFVDINSFTSFAEDHSSTEVVDLLNQYFSLITEETFNYAGTIDKFLGDGVMIFFNAPTKQPEHAKQAVDLAIHLQEQITINSNLPLSVSIGINTGLAVVGNIGSKTRSDYTAIGNVVNTASRIENLANKDEICIGEKTYKKIKDCYQTEVKLETKLRGKSKLDQVYKIIY